MPQPSILRSDSFIILSFQPSRHAPSSKLCFDQFYSTRDKECNIYILGPTRGDALTARRPEASPYRHQWACSTCSYRRTRQGSPSRAWNSTSGSVHVHPHTSAGSDTLKSKAMVCLVVCACTNYRLSFLSDKSSNKILPNRVFITHQRVASFQYHVGREKNIEH